MTGADMQAEWDEAAALEALRNLRRDQLGPRAATGSLLTARATLTIVAAFSALWLGFTLAAAIAA